MTNIETTDPSLCDGCFKNPCACLPDNAPCDPEPLTAEQIVRQAKIDDARKVLAFFEENPDLKLPYGIGYIYGSFYSTEKDEFLKTVKAFGTCEKKLDDQFIAVTKHFGSVQVKIEIVRSAVCRKVLVTKEVEEWDCPPLISGAELAEAGLSEVPA